MLRRAARWNDPPSGAAPSEPAFGVVVVGGSAGGLGALSTLLAGLTPPPAVAVAVVLHISREFRSYLPEILARRTTLHVRWAEHGDSLVPGVVHIAPRDRHLLVGAHQSLLLSNEAPVHFSRPAIDPLFISAAWAFGRRTLAIVLSGNGSDGTDGALAVRHAGGVVIAQDRATSAFFGMPGEAIRAGGTTRVLPLGDISALVTRLLSGDASRDR